MPQRKDILKIAAAEVGYKEGKNNSNKYGAWYGMNNQPWCAIFISWLAAQVQAMGSNNKSGTIPRTAWVPDYQNYYNGQKRYKAKGTYKPQLGDLIIYGSNSHVGIVESCDGVNVVTIEGNTSSGGNSANGDGVYRRKRRLTDSWIKGYCCPAYKGDDEEVEIKEVEIKEVKVKSLDTGNMIAIQAVNVNGENYIRLRDMEKMVPVIVDWDGKNPTINLAYK